jgi:hypothetical protein
MRIDCALLCDAATVREGLLHVLGGGISRAGRPQYPAPAGLTLALRILIHPTEADREHQLDVRLQGEDGQDVAAVSITFAVSNAVELEPGEQASLPLPLPLPAEVLLPAPGRYSFELLIDGIHQTSVPFIATTTPPTEGPDEGGA